MKKTFRDALRTNFTSAEISRLPPARRRSCFDFFYLNGKSMAEKFACFARQSHRIYQRNHGKTLDKQGFSGNKSLL